MKLGKSSQWLDFAIIVTVSVLMYLTNNVSAELLCLALLAGQMESINSDQLIDIQREYIAALESVRRIQ